MLGLRPYPIDNGISVDDGASSEARIVVVVSVDDPASAIAIHCVLNGVVV